MIRSQAKGVGTIIGALFCVSSLAAQPAAQEPPLPQGLAEEHEEPPLPAGLSERDEPPLPQGLDESADGEPRLPQGLRSPSVMTVPATEGDEVHFTGDEDEFSEDPLIWSGFIDFRTGMRTSQDPAQRSQSLLELRANFSVERNWEPAGLGVRISSDFIWDALVQTGKVDLKTGEGVVDLREAYAVASPLSWLDLKLGRQLLTWGTGDLLFINDLFPKDWTAYLIGREQAYLKAPSDAAKVSLFSSLANLDLILTPLFDADRYPDRERLSFWDPRLGRVVGGVEGEVDTPDDWFVDYELAARLYQTVGGVELAAYGYLGNWKSPAGMNSDGSAFFPELGVYGASLRSSIFGGIGNIEAGYYDSVSDRAGTDISIRNSEVRALVAYERETFPKLTVGVQVYAEFMLGFEHFEGQLPPDSTPVHRLRDRVTLRFSYSALRDTVLLNVFLQGGVTERDWSILSDINYLLDDHLSVAVGSRTFGGRDDYTYFGQFQSNSNVFGSVRVAW